MARAPYSKRKCPSRRNEVRQYEDGLRKGDEGKILRETARVGSAIYDIVTRALRNERRVPGADAGPPGRHFEGYGSREHYIARRVTETGYGSAVEGTRVWCFVPDKLRDGNRAPVIIYLHGFRASAPNLYWEHIHHLTAQGYVVLFPRIHGPDSGIRTPFHYLCGLGGTGGGKLSAGYPAWRRPGQTRASNGNPRAGNCHGERRFGGDLHRACRRPRGTCIPHRTPRHGTRRFRSAALDGAGSGWKPGPGHAAVPILPRGARCDAGGLSLPGLHPVVQALDGGLEPLQIVQIRAHGEEVLGAVGDRQLRVQVQGVGQPVAPAPAMAADDKVGGIRRHGRLQGHEVARRGEAPPALTLGDRRSGQDA